MKYNVSVLNKFLLILTVVLITSINSNAQKKPSKLQIDFINTLLSDTSAIPHSTYLIPLKIRLRGTKTIKICHYQTQFLFLHFKKQFGWDGRKFMNTLRPYLLYDKVFEVDDDEYFKTSKKLSLNECKMLKNESSEELMKTVKAYQTTIDAQFSCLVYRCFKKQLIVILEEESFSVSRFPFSFQKD